jgi:hypothetical protein
LGGLQFEDRPGKQFVVTHLQNNQIKTDWRCGSSLQSLVQTPVPSNKKEKNFFVILGFEPRASGLTSSHSTSLFVLGIIEIGGLNYFPGLASNCNSLDFSLLSS